MIKALWKRLSESSFLIFGLTLVLNGLGLIALYSIGTYEGSSFMQNAFYKQLLFMIPALVAFFIALFIPRRLIHKYSYLLFGIMLLFIAIPYFGPSVAGTHRWINMGLPVGIQPSEFAKWILVITLARYLSDHTLEMHHFSSILFPIFLALVPFVIVFKQPDLGTALILFVPVFPMLYWVGARPFHLFLFLAPLLSILTAFHTVSFSIWATVLLIILVLAKPTIFMAVVTYFSNIFLGLLAPVLWNLLRPYQKNRILTLINPDLDPLGAAYQIIQSKTAIGSGGFWGKGLGQGTQTHLKFLPVQESDFIVSVIGEELGFIAIAFMLVLFTLLIIKIINLATNSNDRFSGLIIFGIGSIFLAHVFVNCAMSVGLIPVKGLPLPFISYGGSFLVSCYIMIGLVMNLGVNRPD
ncbi:MAG: rod shape-determining protein RodA [Fidelibacterota bacterium]